MDEPSAFAWFGVVVNAVVALIAIYGIKQARDEAKRARAERDEARRELKQDQERQVVRRQAEHDLALLVEVARLHGATREPNVYLTPIEVGRLRSSLAALPAGGLPLTRAWVFGGRPLSPTAASSTRRAMPLARDGLCRC